MVSVKPNIFWQRNKVKFWDFCEHCNRYAILRSYHGRTWGHVYEIPIVPSSGKIQILNSCSKCQLYTRLKLKDMPNILINIEEEVKLILSFFKNKNIELHDAANHIYSLLYCIKIFIATNNTDKVDQEIIAKAEKLKLNPLADLVRGYKSELSGNLHEACAYYRKAIKYSSAHEFIYYNILGRAYQKYNLFKSKVDILQKVLQLETYPEHRQQTKLELLEVLPEVKSYNLALQYFNECFTEDPSLAKDKEFYKSYKIICKKMKIKPLKVKEIHNTYQEKNISNYDKNSYR